MNILFFLCVFMLPLASVFSNDASIPNRESKLGGDPKFHFFRIGRGKESANPVGRDPSRVYTANDFESENKRSSDSNTALWFGPRLGVHKRDGHETPYTYILLNDGNEYRPEYSILPGKNFQVDDEYQSMVFEPIN
ncbi:hypothetical protein WA026_023606 [Henosepilachna vigintioctopunctata]|uniref:Uncharacterized protein n=1 Tax=Henosepilachna vigintioctopunctata TaxID=420089 RepID=A0AAW1UHB5_9CUCU